MQNDLTLSFLSEKNDQVEAKIGTVMFWTLDYVCLLLEERDSKPSRADVFDLIIILWYDFQLLMDGVLKFGDQPMSVLSRSLMFHILIWPSTNTDSIILDKNYKTYQNSPLKMTKLNMMI